MSLVYLAGPITGLAYGDATDWRRFAAADLSYEGISAASPLRFKDFLEGELDIKDQYEDHPLATSKAIYTRDRWDVGRCDVVLVNFVGATKVSIGTVWEIGLADMARKPIVIAMEKDNIHRHSLITESAGYIVESLEEALDVVKALLVVNGER